MNSERKVCSSWQNDVNSVDQKEDGVFDKREDSLVDPRRQSVEKQNYSARPRMS